MSDRCTLSRAELEAFDSSPHGGAKEKRYRCPFCGGSERALHVNMATGLYNCKRASCGVSGQLSDFWKRAPSSQKERSRLALKVAFGEPLRVPVPSSPLVSSGNWQEQWERALPLSDPRSEMGARYLSGRGIGLEVGSAASVRFSSKWAPSAEGKEYHAGAAVLFPSMGEGGDVVAVSGRYLRPWTSPEGDTIKARTGGEAKEGVFLAPARIGADWFSPFDRRLDAVIIVEGQADALSLAQVGFPALAAGGVNLAPWLHRRVGLRRVFLALDADRGGDEAAPKWESYLSNYGAKCARLEPEGAKDWNEMLMSTEPSFLADWLMLNYTQQDGSKF